MISDLILSLRDTFYKKHTRQYAARFSASNSDHMQIVSQLLLNNKVGVMAFNGVYGLFTNADSKSANNRILKIKNRPSDKNLVLVAAPEYLNEYVDFTQTYYSHEKVIALQRYLHALGVILPAGAQTPPHLVSHKENKETILSIWTEYDPLRNLIDIFRASGGRSLAGTSANKSGQPSHIKTEEVWEDFKRNVDFFVEANFDHLPEIRRKSTSVIDLTQKQPRLHRLGNVSKEEIQEALHKFKFPELHIDDAKTIHVRPHHAKLSN
jgi:L-threonylcarbamoyladenylate synthase